MQSAIANLLPALNPAPIVAEISAKNCAPDVASLTAGIRAGNEEAFREFHKLYFDRLYQFLLVVARGNEAEARDALQETLLRVIRHARKFDSEDAFWSWLKVVARNAARDAGRKQCRYFNLVAKIRAAFRNSCSQRQLNSAARRFARRKSGGTAHERPRIDPGKIPARRNRQRTRRRSRGLTEKAAESLLLRVRQRIREFILNKLK